jgi:dephospho-CoA kinase
MIGIGLTGNIACGKSTVARMLESLGAHIIDADKVVHEQMAPDRLVWTAIVSTFGTSILNPDRTIDRAKLGTIVFANPAALERLEAITHPAALQAITEEISQLDDEVVVVEAVKLVEASWHSVMKSFWVVTCSREIQLRRLLEDRGMSEADAIARLDAQPAIAPKLLVADTVIDNSGTREQTLAQVTAAFKQLIASRSDHD